MSLFISILLATSVTWSQPTQTIVLDGQHLTLEQTVAVADNYVDVAIHPAARERMQRSFDLLVEATVQRIPIYGVNLGVGGNSTDSTFQGSLLEPENLKLSLKFNARNIRASSSGAGPLADVAQVRAAMVLRLNDLLVGDSGARPEVAEVYAAMLNRSITPLVPSVGSTSQADLGMMSHIGLAAMGEGDVDYAGQKISARLALQIAGIAPLQPYGVDSLAIMSSNAYSEGLTVLALRRLQHLARASEMVYAVSMEAMQETIMPLLPVVRRARPVPGLNEVAVRILEDLRGSYLMNAPYNNDYIWALSFGNAANHFATLWTAEAELNSLLSMDINASTNNPMFLVQRSPDADTEAIRAGKFIVGPTVSGYYFYTNGYEPFHWSVKLDGLKSIVNQMSSASAFRMIQLDNPALTGLGNFLSPGNGVLAFSEVQKVVEHVRLQNQRLSLSNVGTGLPLAGGGEDVASNAAQSAIDLNEMIDNLYILMGLELMHSAQAVDLRLRADPTLALGRGTSRLRGEFRKVVSFLNEDRSLTPDIEAAARFVRTLSVDQTFACESKLLI